ncbi:O-acetylhomoserine aminocarboxypropyltransferase/cysteine synthase family protein [Arcanobacterium hippocoleae]|uniref:O-acetylhomoserine aminocarboxypropyltransferase/cysteine synthase family protein n=1 Tax=Arcanobacterium hippocoleae TaxID=149017 RepID=UPI003341949D
MKMTNWNFETIQIHAGQTPDSDTGSRALPIYQTTSFVFENTEQAANRFALTESGPIYTRLTNPTQQVVEARIAALEGGRAALLVASGQAALTTTILNIAQAGDHIVASSSLYGGSVTLLKNTLSRYGITTTFVTNQNDPEAWRTAVTENTKAFFAESIPNPGGNIFDIEAIAAVAHEIGVPLIVDNTIATPYLLRPFEHGADIVIHSATKFLGGHGTAIGGVIVEKGGFNWLSGKFPTFSEADPSYNGLQFGSLDAIGAFVTRIRCTLLRDLGPAISPFNAFLIAQGIETLSLRLERHVENAAKVAHFLEHHPAVENVTWASLESSPYFELAQKYTPKGAGSVFAFTIKGGKEAGQAFIDALELHSLVANIGDVRSLAIHPASTTHSQLSDSALAAAGVNPGLVRLSVGIESADDIIADLAQAFAKIS